MSHYGIDRRFLEGRDGFFRGNASLKEEIVDNVTNWLLTNRNSRVMRPSFGADLYHYLFEPSSPELDSVIVDVIVSGIEKHFNYLQIENIFVELLERRMTVNLLLSYNGERIEINQVIEANIDG